MAKVFISYRRMDSASVTGRMHDHLVAHFGRENVFKDVDNLPPGADLGPHITQVLRQCTVALVIIGRDWLNATADGGGRRLDDPSDWVRMEVETALELNLTVIPILVEGASMPAAKSLPPSLQALANRNGLQVRDDPDFAHDMDRMLAAVGHVLAPEGGSPPYSSSSQGFGGQPTTTPRKKVNVGLIVGTLVGAILIASVGYVGLLHAPGQLANNRPTPTPTPTVLYSDPLVVGKTSMVDTPHCTAQSDGLHVHDNFACLTQKDSLIDIDVTVQVRQINCDTDLPYGIEVRRSDRGWIEFDIDGSSRYIVFKCEDGDCATSTRLVDHTSSAAIKEGLNATNKLEVRAVGSHFDFSVNGTRVGGVDDASFAAGDVGLSANDSVEVVYTSLKITKPQAR
jgi:TIR domain